MEMNAELDYEVPTDTEEPEHDETSQTNGHSVSQKLAGEVSKVNQIRKIRMQDSKLRRNQTSSKPIKGTAVEFEANGEDSGSGSSTRGDAHKSGRF